MKPVSTDHKGIANRIVWVAIGLALLFWVLETALHVFVFHKGNFIGQLFYPTPNEIWMRSLVVFLIIALGICAHAMINKNLRAEKTIRESEENLAVTLNSIGDAVIVTDKYGKVTRMNPVAENLTGWEFDEAEGRPLSETFHVINAQSREVVTNPVEKVLREGKIVGLGNHTALIARDGTERQIADSGAPIRNKGDVIGVVMVFRDITQEYRTQQKLQESEENFRHAFYNANTGMCLVDLNGVLFEVNDQMSEIFGFSVEEMKGISVNDLAHPDDLEISPKFIERSIAGETADSQFEKRYIHKDGHIVWGLVSSSLVRDSSDNPLYFISHVQDITERKWAEDALKTAEREKATIINAVLELLVYQDTEHRILWANRAACESVGITPEDLVGRYCYEIWQQRDEPCPDCPVSEAIESGQSQEKEITTPEGRVWHIRGYPVFDANGKVKGGVEVTLDITERKRAEDALRNSERFLADLFESVQDGISVLSTDLTILHVNGVMKRWYSENLPLEGKNCHECYQNSDKPCDPCPTLRCFSTGQTEREVVPGIPGSPVEWVELFSYPLKDKESGEVTGAVEFVRDITERKRTEQELAKIQKLESLGILAGGIAHDFNNLLTAILGNITLAKIDQEYESRSFEFLSDAEKTCLRAKDLTGQLLTFAKGGAPIKRIAVVANLIKDSARFAVRGSNVRCDFSIPDDLWPAMIDEGQISQVINNLVINADQAMPEGGVIELSAENFIVGERSEKQVLPLEDGEYVRISVKDDGIGISTEHLPKIFDPYFTTKQQGSGLGLATSYSIIKQHDGHITAESELGAGTTFCIYLPASEETIPQHKEKKEIVAGKGKILFMDDEEAVRITAGKLLEQLGYKVEFACDGEEAARLYKKAKESGKPFDAAIIDLTIPGGMGGKKTIKKLLGIDPDVKAIVSSGYSNDPVMANFEEYGFRNVLVKPYLMEELSVKLHQLIGGEEI